MKGCKVKRIFPLLGVFFLSIMSLWAVSHAITPETTVTEVDPVIEVSPELRKQYPIKVHHAKLSMDCIHCHEGQGTNPEEFEYIGDEGCIKCHGSKEKIAQRTGYMDRFHTNPHNSFHDGPTLSCDECHQVHQESINMCAECHEKEVPNWMKVVAP